MTKSTGGSSGGSSGGTRGGPATGGTTGTGGTANAGGMSGGSGGTGRGGTTGTGGTANAGGTSGGSGGTVISGTKNSGTTVTFDKGKAKGAMTGYGWVMLGKLDSVTDPTCGPNETPITSTTACASDINWSATDKLCITGGCPALDPDKPDYDNNYGVVVGVNAGDAGGTGDASMVLGQTFKTITVAATGMPTSEVRIQIHRKGDPDSSSYCIKYSSSAIDLTKFATDCWETSPTKPFAAADIPNIDKVSLEAISASTKVSVSDMCMTGITFGN